MEKVLLAIEEYSTLSFFVSILSEQYQIDAFSNEVDAINSLQSNRYAFILVDFDSQKFDGKAILQYLTSSHQISNQPVTCILNKENLQTEIELFNKGCAEIFCKPFDSILTRRRIQNVITIYKLRKNVADYERKLITDPLTGLLNREGFQSLVRKFLKDGLSGALIMCDMDGLKYMNDNFSHQLGDEIIQQVATYLEKESPKGSFVAHLSGDEFCIFLLDTCDKDVISDYCQNLQKKIVRKVLLPDLSRPVTLSIGISLFPESASTYENLMTKADHALLYVKNHGKNNYKFHTPRDDREKMLKGRQECTDVPIDLMLKKRADEDKQTWLKFGEFRVVYITYKKYSSAVLETQLCLLNIRDLKNPDCPDSKKILSLNDKITTFLKDSLYPGIFSWYSINQLLIFTTHKETLPRGVENLKNELLNEMKALQLEIEYVDYLE